MNVRMAQQSSSFLLASLKPSTYARRMPWAMVRCRLAGRIFSPFFIALLMMLGAVVVTAAQEENPVSGERAFTRQAAGLILTRCTICHTTDLIAQQRLPEERWTATLEKMVRWGAVLSREEQAMLLQFLTTRYRPGAADPLPSIEHEAESGMN